MLLLQDTLLQVPTRSLTQATRTQHRMKSSIYLAALLKTTSRHGVCVSLTRDTVSSSLPADYELVRIYHPDSPVNRRLPSATAQVRFQAITAAYDTLRGKTRYDSEHPEAEKVKHNLHNLNSAMWKARQQRRAELRVGLDDRWKDSIMLGAVVVVRYSSGPSDQCECLEP